MAQKGKQIWRKGLTIHYQVTNFHPSLSFDTAINKTAEHQISVSVRHSVDVVMGKLFLGPKIMIFRFFVVCYQYKIMFVEMIICEA